MPGCRGSLPATTRASAENRPTPRRKRVRALELRFRPATRRTGCTAGGAGGIACIGSWFAGGAALRDLERPGPVRPDRRLAIERHAGRRRCDQRRQGQHPRHSCRTGEPAFDLRTVQGIVSATGIHCEFVTAWLDRLVDADRAAPYAVVRIHKDRRELYALRSRWLHGIGGWPVARHVRTWISPPTCGPAPSGAAAPHLAAPRDHLLEVTQVTFSGLWRMSMDVSLGLFACRFSIRALYAGVAADPEGRSSSSFASPDKIPMVVAFPKLTRQSRICRRFARSRLG